MCAHAGIDKGAPFVLVCGSWSIHGDSTRTESIQIQTWRGVCSSVVWDPCSRCHQFGRREPSLHAAPPPSPTPPPMQPLWHGLQELAGADARARRHRRHYRRVPGAWACSTCPGACFQMQHMQRITVVHLHVWHTTWGLFLPAYPACLQVVQLVTSCLRPNPDHPARPVWNFGHHWTGRCAFILAFVQLMIGPKVCGGGGGGRNGFGCASSCTGLVVAVMGCLGGGVGAAAVPASNCSC